MVVVFLFRSEASLSRVLVITILLLKCLFRTTYLDGEKKVITLFHLFTSNLFFNRGLFVGSFIQSILCLLRFFKTEPTL